MRIAFPGSKKSGRSPGPEHKMSGQSPAPEHKVESFGASRGGKQGGAESFTRLSICPRTRFGGCGVCILAAMKLDSNSWDACIS